VEEVPGRVARLVPGSFQDLCVASESGHVFLTGKKSMWIIYELVDTSSNVVPVR
jgi:hypothetical protein